MALGDMKLLSLMKAKMSWHQARQQVLADTVANADTPGYSANELQAFRVDKTSPADSVRSVAASRTHQSHFAAAIGPQSDFKLKNSGGWEITPAGNAVVLEEQMMKVSANQFDYQLASTLYSRSLGLLRTALGRTA
ncbi:MAG: flagellar basal-body rod protein FlgB [Pseudomonadota bacterium]|nr:flagellar basal-body rod protein FlgB [Pseudomonadota bacterium]